MRKWFGLFGALMIMPAQASDLSSLGLSGLIDVRAAFTDGEKSFTDGGFGKLRFGGDDDDWNADLELARAALVWRNQLTWTTSAYVQIEIDPIQDHPIDIGEAFVKYKAPPNPNLRWSVRAGAFYPPVSMEHDGDAWSVTRTITPSAINSWIGEEVKLAGIEGSTEFDLGEGKLNLTGGLFGYNDTSGTLLTFRGWALHDHQTPLNGSLALPTRDEAWWSSRSQQARIAEPFREIDDDIGYYVRADWHPAAPVTLNLTWYDNRGDVESAAVFEDGQTSWGTSFTNLGLRAQPFENLEILSQVMWGETLWVPLSGAPIPYVDDVGFQSAFILANWQLEDQSIATRIDLFETYDQNQPYSLISRPEDGWAITAAWQKDLSQNLGLILEAVYVDSTRASRVEDGIAASQAQTSLQASLRWNF